MVLNAYLAELDGAVRGPRRAKLDLLTEVRDSLVDATRAYQERGLGREAAERRAVREFGEVREIAPDYQAELGLAQARRTALVVLLIVAGQYLVSTYAWRSQASAWTWTPGPAYRLLAQAVDWLSLAVVVGSLAVVLACGVGARYLRARRGITRATGIAAGVVYVSSTVAGLVLTLASPLADARWASLTGALWIVGFWVVPAWIAVSARRCLSAVHVRSTISVPS